MTKSKSRTCSKETRDLHRRIVAAGGQLRRGRSGHWKVYRADVYLFSMSGTGEVNAVRQAERDCRRHGLEV